MAVLFRHYRIAPSGITGGRRSEAQLVNALFADKLAVTYMWADKATALSNLKIVAELW